MPAHLFDPVAPGLEQFNQSVGADHVLHADDHTISLEWTIRGTQPSGERIEVRGCDLIEFVDGKISRKDSFWKIIG